LCCGDITDISTVQIVNQNNYLTMATKKKAAKKKAVKKAAKKGGKKK